MKFAAGLISVALALVTMSLPATTAAQMMQGGMMGGGRHGMINLVSPADSPTQIRLGTLMIGQYLFGMMGQNSMGSGTPAPGANGTPGLRLVLRPTDTAGHAPADAGRGMHSRQRL